MNTKQVYVVMYANRAGVEIVRVRESLDGAFQTVVDKVTRLGETFYPTNPDNPVVKSWTNESLGEIWIQTEELGD